jgi:hypothetical protein
MMVEAKGPVFCVDDRDAASIFYRLALDLEAVMEFGGGRAATEGLLQAVEAARPFGPPPRPRDCRSRHPAIGRAARRVRVNTGSKPTHSLGGPRLQGARPKV